MGEEKAKLREKWLNNNFGNQDEYLFSDVGYFELNLYDFEMVLSYFWIS